MSIQTQNEELHSMHWTFYDPRYILQSGDVVESCCDEAQSSQMQQNVRFDDEIGGHAMDIRANLSIGNMDGSSNSSLSEFLSRPVVIVNADWTEATVFDQTYEPWKLFFNNAAIKRKLDNYFLIRCNLKIKLVVNASPFYYGLLLTSYRPMTDSTSSNFNPCPIESGTGLTDVAFVGRSQRPHFYSYPQTCQGGEMTLPFFYNKQWLDITNASLVEQMGTINVSSLETLKNANGVSGESIGITMYAWAEDVELAAPTSKLALQTEDEYEHNGVISGPASAVSRFADNANVALDALSGVTGGVSLILKPFATATSLVSSAVGQAASLLGYTNVPVIDDVHAMKGQAFPHLASTQIGTPVEKLTLDAKNELCVDPASLGIDSNDELLISNIVSRESFIDNFTWSKTDIQDTLLWNIRITPTLLKARTVSSRNYVQGVPMWMVGEMFNYWRGDIWVRLKFVCSKYHRGRVRISWDPRGNISNTVDTTNTVYTNIVDISRETDVAFRIPYMQDTPYQKSIRNNSEEYYGTGSQSFATGYQNGILTVRVVNEQSAPVASAVIDCYAFVSGAENLEFAGPRQVQLDLTPYTTQSADEISYDTTTEIVVSGKPSVTHPALNLLYMGEKVVSLRTLMRRSVRHLCFLHDDTGTNVYSLLRYNLRRLPLYPGYDPNGIHTANDTIGASTSPYNFVPWGAITWVGQCFIGVRGSVIWHANVISGDRSAEVAISRDPEATLSVANYATIKAASAGSNESAVSRLTVTELTSGMDGMSLTNQETQAGVSVLCPMYSRYKFLSAGADTRTLGDANDETNKDGIQCSVAYTLASGGAGVTAFYMGAGTDFNLNFFLNVPTLYESSVPTSA